jgi:hypothetical protein
MADSNAVKELTLSEWQDILGEIQQQPAWRRDADTEADYYDGNQLDSETLQAMQELGMAPIIENLIAPSIDSVLGMEAKNRLDWRVTSQGSNKHAEIAEAINEKLNEAERESKADRACADAYAAQCKVGAGWVTVGHEHDPFKYLHRAEYVHRNEVFWDWNSREPDLSDARYLVRKRWHDVDVLQVAFPKQADLIKNAGYGWATTDIETMLDGGQSTGLSRGYAEERAWTLLEHEWRQLYRRRLCLSEVWYRRWVRIKVLRAPDGRVVEFDPDNFDHQVAVQSGMVQLQEAMTSKVRLSWWIGPHKLADIPNPYGHGKIPYVPFFGKREDLTGVPYGLIRPMKSLQDEINARNTKMQWLLVAKRVTMTRGVADVNTTRNEAARPDAVHVLDPAKMRDGGVFKVESDFTLNQQQYQALVDKRESLKNVAGIYKAFEGQNGNATSGRAIDSLVDQSTQTLAEINDNFRFARAAVGDLLMSNVTEEIGQMETDVEVKGAFATGAKVIKLNQRAQDEQGREFLNNDLQRARLKVALSDVPSTASYRKQRFMLLSELGKSLPPNLQAIMLPYIVAASDEPERDVIVKELRKALGQASNEPAKTPEEQAERDAADAQAREMAALQKRLADMQFRELAAKVEKMEAETDKLLREIHKPVAVEVAEINADSRKDLAAMNHGAATESRLQTAAIAQLTNERQEEAGEHNDSPAEEAREKTLETSE